MCNVCVHRKTSTVWHFVYLNDKKKQDFFLIFSHLLVTIMKKVKIVLKNIMKMFRFQNTTL